MNNLIYLFVTCRTLSISSFDKVDICIHIQLQAHTFHLHYSWEVPFYSHSGRKRPVQSYVDKLRNERYIRFPSWLLRRMLTWKATATCTVLNSERNIIRLGLIEKWTWQCLLKCALWIIKQQLAFWNRAHCRISLVLISTSTVDLFVEFLTIWFNSLPDLFYLKNSTTKTCAKTVLWLGLQDQDFDHWLDTFQSKRQV